MLIKIRNSILLLLWFLCTPVFSYAALNAGVVNGVWFSNPNPEDGEHVRIFTAVQNSSTQTIEGTVAFLVDKKIIGTAPFTVMSNDIMPISVEYIFKSGAHDVSAYITTVAHESVTYTTVPNTSVSVTTRITEDSTQVHSASSTIAATTELLTEQSKNIIAKLAPSIESTADRIDNFRNSLLVSTSSSNTTNVSSTTSPLYQSPKTKKEAAQNFLHTSGSIAKDDSIPIWKRVVGILLSVLTLCLRFWFIFFILIFALIFWIMIRGRRIW